VVRDSRFLFVLRTFAVPHPMPSSLRPCACNDFGFVWPIRFSSLRPHCGNDNSQLDRLSLFPVPSSTLHTLSSAPTNSVLEAPTCITCPPIACQYVTERSPFESARPMVQPPQQELSHSMNPMRGHLRPYPFDERTNVVVPHHLHCFFERQAPTAAAEHGSQRTRFVRSAVPLGLRGIRVTIRDSHQLNERNIDDCP